MEGDGDRGQDGARGKLGGATGKGWLPGQSGNPGGRPKGASITSRLLMLLDKGEINGQPIKDGKQVADMLAEVILKGALKGDFRFAKEVLDRTEGKVTDKVEHSGGVGGPILIGVPARDVASEELEAWRKKMAESLAIERPTSPAADRPSS